MPKTPKTASPEKHPQLTPPDSAAGVVPPIAGAATGGTCAPKDNSPGADEIAAMAARGEDVSGYFTNRFTVVRPVHRVNVDLTHGMLRDLDERAARLNVSRQAVIKTLLARALSDESRVQVPKRRA